MNYYLDTEFIEDFTRPVFGKPRHFIDLISIALVAEDGREYFAVSNEFNLEFAWNRYDLQLPEQMGDAPIKVYWLRDNVLKPLYQYLSRRFLGENRLSGWSKYDEFTYETCKSLIKLYGKSNKQIAAEIKEFCGNRGHGDWNTPVFYGYYADYDWVLFCSLFGRMIGLPKGYPMYCRDLKQMMDELNITKEELMKGHMKCWANNEHHALADARWNQRLHKALLQEAKVTKPYLLS